MGGNYKFNTTTRFIVHRNWTGFLIGYWLHLCIERTLDKQVIGNSMEIKFGTIIEAGEIVRA